jgi:hypothetical protein
LGALQAPDPQVEQGSGLFTVPARSGISLGGTTMPFHWGVDSFNSAFAKPGGTGGKTLWDFVTTTYGRPPTFWGRYLNGAATHLTIAEVNFLLHNDCRIVPVVIPNSDNMQAKGRQGYANGRRSGNTTLELADNLHMPAEVFLYIDIEDWMKPSTEWMDGWTDVMEESKYGGGGGFYCLPDNFNFASAYRGLLGKYPDWPQSQRSLWSASPHLNGLCGSKTDPAFTPNSPTVDPGVVAIWQYAIGCHGNLVDLNLANDDGFNVMWGKQTAPAARRKPNRGNVVATPVGRWEVYVGVWAWNYIFRADNTVLWTDIVQPSVIQPGTGTWSIDGTLLKITWFTGNVEEWRLPLTTNQVIGEYTDLENGDLVEQGSTIEARQLSDVPR